MRNCDCRKQERGNGGKILIGVVRGILGSPNKRTNSHSWQCFFKKQVKASTVIVVN